MLVVEELSKSFGGVGAMRDVTLNFAPGSLTAIIGPNGAGKTTFFNLISGAMRPDRGSVKLAGEDIAAYRQSKSYAVVSRARSRLPTFFHPLLWRQPSRRPSKRIWGCRSGSRAVSPCRNAAIEPSK